VVRLTLHARAHLGGDEKVATSSFVRCPDDDRWAPVEACRRCSRFTGVDLAGVTCAHVAGATSGDAQTASITAVVEPSVLCVHASASTESVKRTMDELGVRIAVVVDGDRHPIGVCLRADLPPQARARRVARFMTPFVITMLGSTTVADVVALIVDRNLDNLPVLSEGRVVGVVTQRAVIRWLAQNLEEARRAHP
jgi:CBS domain-containing protein